MRLPTMCILVGLLAGCATQRSLVTEAPPQPPIHVSQLSPESDEVGDQVVFLDPGDTVPLTLSLESPILGLSETEVPLVVKERLFIWVDVPDGLNKEAVQGMDEAEQHRALRGTKIFLSRDGKRWTPMTNVRALKEAFGVTGGQANFGLSVSSKEGVRAMANVKAFSERE